MKRLTIELVVVFFCLSIFRLRACGPDFPNNLLDSGDAAVLQAPVADFQSELARMRLVRPREYAVPLAEGQKFSEQSTELEMADLAAALKRERTPPELATVILQAHLAERMKLNAFLAQSGARNAFNPWVAVSNSPPVFPDVTVTPGLPREFADYFGGAIAWHNNDNNGWEAAQAWEQVLALPAAERHFKSTWAAYMLAQYYQHLPEADDEEALKYFAQVGELARNGFADSAGLATASIGGEAQIWLGRKNYERAIELYLEQFAAGDQSAVNSLRFTAARAVVKTNSTAAQLKSLALNARTRRVITAYLISRTPYTDPREADSDPDAGKFFDQTDAWLGAVEAADIKDVESASSLALAAYQASRMDIAQRWVRRAGKDPVAQWLQAKLFLREGNIVAAARLLAKLSRGFPRQPPMLSAPSGLAGSLRVPIDEEGYDSISMNREVLGELGVLHLARREYVESLDALLRSGYWGDAAYVAEDVLTTVELKTYVDRDWPLSKAVENGDNTPDGNWGVTSNPGESIRDLLARRLARESIADDARAYYPTNDQANFEARRAALLAGQNTNLPPAERARNLVAAAFMTCTNGMNLVGTELSPDWGIFGGDYDLSGPLDAGTNGNSQLMLPTADETRRAARHRLNPDARFHYRFQAANLALEAAKLMPDNSNETAWVLCTAGSWIEYLDPISADVLYKALVRRCRKTTIGEAAEAIRWFPVLDDAGNPIPYRPRVPHLITQPEFDSISMMDRRRGWAQNGNNAILATTNGGQSWKTVLVASTNQYLNGCFADATNAGIASFYYGDDTNVTIRQTSNGGKSWRSTELAQACPLMAAFPAFSASEGDWLTLIPDHTMNSSPGYLYSLDGNGIFQPVNSTEGSTYEGDNYATEEFARPHAFLSCGGATSWRDQTNGWLLGSMESTTPAFLFGTADGGHTWQLQTLDMPDSEHDGRMVPDGLPQFFPRDGTNGVLGAEFVPQNPDSTNSFRVIYATRDGGQTWNPLTPVKNGKTWDFISDQTGWMWSQEPAYYVPWTAPVKGTLYRTDDAGFTWQPVSGGGGLAGCLTQRDHVVQLDFVDQNCGWALIQKWNDLDTRLLQTTDGGRSWHDLPMQSQR